MGLFAKRAALVFDAASISGGRARGTVGGGGLRAVERVPLDEGALAPSPTEPNLRRESVVKAALDELLSRLGRPTRAVLVLPLGVARLALLEAERGADPRDLARFRLAPGLPFPAEEAIVDALPAGGGRLLAGAVRRPVVAEYERLVTEAGLSVERVDLWPMAAAAARQAETGLELFLGDVAFGVADRDGGELRAFQCRWRDRGPGDLERIGRVLAAARLQAGPVTPRIQVFGRDAEAVAAGLFARGFPCAAGPDLTLLGSAA
jgi:hypothetical protein